MSWQLQHGSEWYPELSPMQLSSLAVHVLRTPHSGSESLPRLPVAG